MTAVGGVSAGTQGTAQQDQAGLVGNYETFLTLLTTQLKNQSPLDPMDANQVTEQLVQYSGVEQQIKANQQMENLVAMSAANNALNSLNFVGKTVTIDGSKGNLTNGNTLTYKFNMPSDAKGTVTIRNASGQVVTVKQGIEFKSGDQSYEWNGKNSAGVRMAPGTYSIQIDALDSNGNNVAATTDRSGKVDKVDVSGSNPLLIIEGQAIAMAQVKSIAQTTN
jgi:flagellar basal-body rod modification protein FlgD